MLSENIKQLRKAKGLSQEELAVKLNVVRQTVSKWEQGLSVPDADMLISISEVFETPVSTLLGETPELAQADTLKAISEKLEVINLQLAQNKRSKRRTLHRVFVTLAALTLVVLAVILALGSPYLGWDYSDPEIAVFGAMLHAFEFAFVRLAPVILIGSLIGVALTNSKD